MKFARFFLFIVITFAFTVVSAVSWSGDKASVDDKGDVRKVAKTKPQKQEKPQKQVKQQEPVKQPKEKEQQYKGVDPSTSTAKGQIEVKSPTFDKLNEINKDKNKWEQK